MKRIKYVELQPLVACLLGYEHIKAGPLERSLSIKFYHKSGTELKLESEQKVKLLTLKNF